MNRKIFYLGVLFFSLLISLPIILPFFHTGYFPSHDGEWAVVRLTDMFRALKDLQIPARYSGNLNFGYGYPLFNFAYPFPYYFGVLIHLLGFGFVNSIKILFASSVFLSAVFMFLLSRKLWGNTWAGVISSILYLYLPYRMVDLYVRGSLGESLSLALFPLLFYLGVRFVNKPTTITISGIGFVIAILVGTHNIMSVFAIPLFVLFVLTQIFLKKKKIIKSFIFSILLGAGLSTFFWLPALYEKKDILLSVIPIADRSLYFVNINQLINPSWGYGIPTDAVNGFSYQLGISQIAAFVIFAIFVIATIFYKNKLKVDADRRFTAFFVFLISVVMILCMFSWFSFVWKLPLLSEINYPWTLLAPIGFMISLLTGYLAINKMARYVALIVALCSIFLVLPYAKPESYLNYGDNYYLTNDATTTSSKELMPLWVKKIPLERYKDKVEIINGKGDIENLSFNSKQIDFSANVLSQSIIRINTIYFPGWKIKIDKETVPISYSNDLGVMDIAVAPGDHEIRATFGETPIRQASNIISLVSFVVALFLLLDVEKRFLSKRI